MKILPREDTPLDDGDIWPEEASEERNCQRWDKMGTLEFPGNRDQSLAKYSQPKVGHLIPSSSIANQSPVEGGEDRWPTGLVHMLVPQI